MTHRRPKTPIIGDRIERLFTCELYCSPRPVFFWEGGRLHQGCPGDRRDLNTPRGHWCVAVSFVGSTLF